MNQLELSEQEILRRESLIKLRELGIDPYPAAEYKINTTSREIKEKYNAEENNFQEVCIAGAS
jgi:lysyl-tRNA synthetase, class II